MPHKWPCSAQVWVSIRVVQGPQCLCLCSHFNSLAVLVLSSFPTEPGDCPKVRLQELQGAHSIACSQPSAHATDMVCQAAYATDMVCQAGSPILTWPRSTQSCAGRPSSPITRTLEGCRAGNKYLLVHGSSLGHHDVQGHQMNDSGMQHRCATFSSSTRGAAEVQVMMEAGLP